MQGTFFSNSCTALTAARNGSASILALLEAVVLDPGVDWIAAKRAAAASRGLDSAMALKLWLTHLQELLPNRLKKLSLLWSDHGAVMLRALEAVERIAILESEARKASEAADRYFRPSAARVCLLFSLFLSVACAGANRALKGCVVRAGCSRS
jgi:hypothetical protein